MNKMLKSGLWLLLALLVLLLIVVALRPAAISVQLAIAEPRTLTVTVEEQGRTRARQPWTVSAPVAGQLARSSLVEGDSVSAGDVLTHMRVAAENPRTEASIRANLAAARARQAASEAALAEAESALERYRNEAQRREQLYDRNMIGAEERDLYRQSVAAAESRVASARSSLEAARADTDMARSLLIGIETNGDASIPIVAPVDGTLYAIHERGDRVLPAGAAIFSISDNDHLELVIDVLTQDAIRVNADDRIMLSGWGGDAILEARVSYIEPEAFTKVSALGVEEQRVNVIGELVDTDPALRAGYRVEAAIIIWSQDNVLTIPTSALFRRDGQWQVFSIADGVASLRPVEIGQRSRNYAEVLAGLQNGDPVIVYPSDQISEGIRVSRD